MLIQNVISSGWNSLATKSLAITNVLVNYSQVRYRKPVAFRKYVQPSFRKKLLLATCEPVMPIDRRPPAERCYNLYPLPKRPDHPYDVLLAKDMAQELEDSALVCLFHQNQMTTSDMRLAKNEFEHEGLYLRYYNNDIARLAMVNTRYAPLLHFAVGHPIGVINSASSQPFTVLFAPGTSKIQKIFRITKKYPSILLMAAMLDKRRLLTVKQLQDLSTMPDIDTQRAMLSQTLNTAQQGLLQSLNYHSSQLTQLLKTHANPPTDQAVEGEDKKE